MRVFAFPCVGLGVEEQLAHAHAEEGVAEELQPLVVARRQAWALVAVRAMGQRLTQQLGALERRPNATATAASFRSSSASVTARV
ncbi:MAG: hypothetical protein R3B99_14425 [Polyangiales bacterium]